MLNFLVQPPPEAKPVSIEQARGIVDDLIAKKGKLFVEHADGAAILPEQFGPTTREFFSRYGTVRTVRGGFRLAAADARPSDYVRGYLSIGHSEDWDVVQKPGNDEVFVVEGAEAHEAEMEVRFPSVYHLVLDEAQGT
ncbi:MAG: hypothetical protein ACJ8HI_15885 [Massilia sp.]